MDTSTTAILIIMYISLSHAEQITLKLVGGSNQYEGNILVKRGSDWGVVCDDSWSIENGNTVCHQLGFGKAVKVTTHNKFESSIVERIFLDDVKCQGHETNLGQCKHREWLQSNCNAAEAAGVVCEGKATPLIPASDDKPLLKIIANTGGTLPTVTRQPFTATEEETTSAEIILPEQVDSETPEIEYSQRTQQILERARLLLSGGRPSRPSTDRPASHLTIPDNDDILSRSRHILSPLYANINIGNTHDELDALDDHQDSIELSLNQAAAALQGMSGSYEMGSDEIEIREPTEAEVEKVDDIIHDMVYKSDQPSSPPAKPYRVEVVGGRRSNEGYVRVTLDNGKAGVICSDNWGIYEAMVVCRQTGKQQAAKSTLIDYFGASSQDKVIYEVNCDGHERSLADCEYKLADRHGVKCSKPMNVAGVVCTSAKLPDLMPNIWALQSSLRIEQKPLVTLTCAMEENCLSSSAFSAQVSQGSFGSSFGGYGLYGGYNAGPTRKLLRFSSNIFNNGTADFRPRQHRNQWEWHSCHQHYHSMGAFSHYDILDSHGNRVAEGHKASFCLEDVECNFPHRKKYSCRGFADQGISVGCADVYKSDIDCQWIDITDISPGAYVFKLNVNPGLEVPELSFDNNAAVCELTYNGYSAKLSNCVLARG